jgi:hypothetical protein
MVISHATIINDRTRHSYVRKISPCAIVDIVTNSQVLFHNGSLLHSKFNTQLLITVHNSSRILTHI